MRILIPSHVDEGEVTRIVLDIIDREEWEVRLGPDFKDDDALIFTGLDSDDEVKLTEEQQDLIYEFLPDDCVLE